MGLVPLSVSRLVQLGGRPELKAYRGPWSPIETGGVWAGRGTAATPGVSYRAGGTAAPPTPPAWSGPGTDTATTAGQPGAAHSPTPTSGLERNRDRYSHLSVLG